MLTSNPGWIKVIKVRLNSFTFMKLDYIRYIVKHISSVLNNTWKLQSSHCKHLCEQHKLLASGNPPSPPSVGLLSSSEVKRIPFYTSILSWCWHVVLVSLWKLHIITLTPCGNFAFELITCFELNDKESISLHTHTSRPLTFF